MVEDRLLAQHDALAECQDFRDLIFLFGQRDRLALGVDFLGVHIDFNGADAQRILLEAAAATDQILHFHEDFLVRQGVDNQVVSPGLEHTQAGSLIHRAGDRDDGRANPAQTQLADDVEIAQPLLGKAQQDDVVIVEFHEIERLFRIVRFIDYGQARTEKRR